MENKKQFHAIQQYLTEFISNIRENDPLPVRAPSYEVSESEIDGQILDIVYHYLNQRDCHPYIRNLVAHRVWIKMRNFDEIDGFTHNKSPYYDSMKLIKDVTNAANTIIRDILCNLSPSITENVPHYLPISHYCIKNSRRKMEDRCIILQDLNTLYDMKFGYPHAYYGVFDGHGGQDSAVYAAAHLHQFLIQNPLYGTNLEVALKHAFHICDTNFIKHAKTERLKGGTTAVVALVRENRLVVAWLGDSQALLVRKRKASHVGEPHTPSREFERKRIDDMGGAVLDIGGVWRVLGQLAVSRAIGDADYKPYISSECDIKSLEISGDEDFLILACDGLWDTLSPKEAVNLVYAYLTQNDGDTDGVGKCLVEAARLAGSEDNITAVVVFLRPVTTLMEEEVCRLERGEVTDVGRIVPIKKDSQPNFTKLFSQPPPKHEEIATDQLATYNPPMDEPAPDYDMDIVAENDAVPTDEEVDAVLAELDSIPDDPEDNEDSSDDGEWKYAKIEPRTHSQIDDILPDKIFNQDTLVVDLNMDPSKIIGIEESTEIPSVVSTEVVNSNSVKGFITSVELNATQESLSIDLNVGDVPDLSAEKIEQTSGPFSIYVSSSPESVSMEDILQTEFSATPFSQDIINGEEKSDTGKESSSLEIVHAQSTIEVTPSSLNENNSLNTQLPDIMTQSFTGELPLIASTLLELDQSPVELDDITDFGIELSSQYISQISEMNNDQIDQLIITKTNESNEPIECTGIAQPEYQSSKMEPVEKELDIFLKDTPKTEAFLDELSDEFAEICSVTNTMDEVETICDVTDTILTEEINILQNQPIFNTAEEHKPDLIEEIQNVSPEKPLDQNQTTENLFEKIDENDMLKKAEVCDFQLKSIVVEKEEIILSPNNITECPVKPVSQRKQTAPITIKKAALAPELRKITKQLPKQSVKIGPKVERAAPRNILIPKEPFKPQLQKDKSVVKKTATKTVTNSTHGMAKSAVTEKKTAKTPRQVLPKSTATKLSENHSSITSKAASSVGERGKQISAATSKPKSVTKVPEKNKVPAKTSTVASSRRPLTNPRPTTTSTVRSTTVSNSRSAVFAPPTKDSKNIANKLLSSKSTTNSTSSRAKLLNKTAPITQKRVPVSGTKTKCIDKPVTLLKKKEEIVSNGNSKNVEKERIAEKKTVLDICES